MRVGIVGAGPAGLTLAHALLYLHGTAKIDEVRVYDRSDVLRPDAILVGHISRAYFEVGTMELVRRAPFRLCKGDIVANVAALASRPDTDPPDEINEWKLWAAMREKVLSQETVVATVQRLANCPCTTNMGEQAHKGAVDMAAEHEGYALGLGQSLSCC